MLATREEIIAYLKILYHESYWKFMVSINQQKITKPMDFARCVTYREMLLSILPAKIRPYPDFIQRSILRHATKI